MIDFEGNCTDRRKASERLNRIVEQRDGFIMKKIWEEEASNTLAQLKCPDAKVNTFFFVTLLPFLLLSFKQNY